MPLLCMNMAVPLGERYSNRDNQVMILSNPQIQNVTPPPHMFWRISIHQFCKAIQLILCIYSIFCFAFALASSKQIHQLDLVICNMFGGLTIYPTMFFAFSPTIREHHTNLIVINIVAVVICFFISLHTLFIWMNGDEVLETISVIHPNSVLYIENQKHSISYYLVTSIFSCINGLCYFIETLIIYLEIKGYI